MNTYINYPPEQEPNEPEQETLYNRQQQLQLYVPESALVVGVGGVGSWVGLDLALMGVRKLVFVDPEVIELSNLNRTPFTQAQVSVPKAVALASLCYERRIDIEVYPIHNKVDSLTEIEKSLLDDIEVVIDCRDSSTPPLDEPLRAKVQIIGGYDGSKITMHVNPNPNSIWGDEHAGYTITPSWLVPPQLIAALICAYISMAFLVEGERIKTFSMEDLLKWVTEKEK